MGRKSLPSGRLEAEDSSTSQVIMDYGFIDQDISRLRDRAWNDCIARPFFPGTMDESLNDEIMLIGMFYDNSIHSFTDPVLPKAQLLCTCDFSQQAHVQ